MTRTLRLQIWCEFASYKVAMAARLVTSDSSWEGPATRTSSEVTPVCSVVQDEQLMKVDLCGPRVVRGQA